MTADFLKIKNVSLHFSIHPSFSYRKHEKQPHTRMFPTPNCLGWNAVLFELHGVYYGLQKFLFWAHLTTEYSSSNISQACLKCFSVDIKHSSACFCFSNGVWCGECAYRAWPECMTYCPHHQVENMFQCFYQTFILFLVLVFFVSVCAF